MNQKTMSQSEQQSTAEEVQPYERFEITSEPAIEYEFTVPQSRRSHREVAEDWLQGVFPDNERSQRESGVIYTSGYSARQRKDAYHTGEVSHGRSTEAVRTMTGLVLVNRECQRGRGMMTRHCHGGTVRWACRDLDIDYEWVDLEFLEAVIRAHLGKRWGPMPSGWTPENITAVESNDGGERSEGSRGTRGASPDSGTLFSFADGDQVFIGSDSTAHGSGQFGFVIGEQAPLDESNEHRRASLGSTPVPGPSEALDLLVPDAVREAEALLDADGDFDPREQRQGEYFFVPVEYTDIDPSEAGTIQKPGVAELPYGGSPMDSHVPRDWKPADGDEAVIERFHDNTLIVAGQKNPETPQEAIDMIRYGEYHHDTSASRDELLDVVPGDVLVRGTVRHRDNEHFVENLGDEWHLACTHDYEVFTPDVRGARVD